MLASLDIQNVVLIERLTLSGKQGLVALTGETGAGKSILLDALGLALGARAESALVRHGAAQATVTAVFDLPAGHPARTKLAEHGFDLAGDDLILRRVVTRDGRSKGFINDAPVSITLLRDIGRELVEIHGQFETQGLLDPQSHGITLDDYADIDVQPIRAAYRAWRDACRKLEDARDGIEQLRLQEEYLKHTVRELQDLAVETGEEDILAEKRRRLMNREKLAGAYDAATALIEDENGIRTLCGRLQMEIAKLDDSDIAAALSRMMAEADELAWQIEKKKSGAGEKGENLADIEERYFAIRAAAKKYRCTSDELPALALTFAEKLRLITHQDDALADMARAVAQYKKEFIALAEQAAAKRVSCAEKLAAAVNRALPPLKLDKATFYVECTPIDNEDEYHERGIDRVRFAVSTNPQTPAGPLHKIASGGELSRFMLALKVILAETGSVPTLIFDEVDSGIGGATADAVGERLQRLAVQYQVLVVTHSPQVAARAAHHWHVSKAANRNGKIETVATHITALETAEARAEEIARMLSGAEITREARAQAKKLLKNKDAA